MMYIQVPLAVALSLISIALAGRGGGPSGGRGSAGYGEVRIDGGGESGRLEFKDNNGEWGTVCDHGFDRGAGDVACKQMGYRRCDKVLDHQHYSATNMPIAICDIKCTGDEDQLADCTLQPSCTQANGYRSCSHNDDVGVTCTNKLDAATIVGIVLGVIILFTLIFALIGLCLCCCWPRCPCFYKNQFYYNERTVLIDRRSPQTIQDHYTFATYPPSSQPQRLPPPPPYNPEDSYAPPLPHKGYQTVPPSAPRY